MLARVASLTDQDLEPDVVLSSEVAGDLEGDADLGGGIRVTLDLARPDTWQKVTIRRWADVDLHILRAAVGDGAVTTLTRLRGALNGGAAVEDRVPADLSAAAPWLRIAALEVLDRWVQLPLDQSLVDAEQGIARFRAAETLPPGAARRQLVGAALAMARRSADGIVAHVSETANGSLPLQPLHGALGRLVDGYEGLLHEVGRDWPFEDRRDTALESVPRAWFELSSGSTQPHPKPYAEATEPDLPPSPGEVASPVDPRQVPARVVAIDADPDRAEIALVGAATGVRVRVPAYVAHRPSLSEERLMVRVVDRSGKERAEGLLTFLPRGVADSGRAVFQGFVELPDADLHDLRAEVLVADREPRLSWSRGELRRVRRAAAFLAAWRQATAETRLDYGEGNGIERLNRLARSSAAHGPDEPLFAGGPSRADLLHFVEFGAGEAHAAIRHWIAATQGPGELLVAELAAVARATDPPDAQGS